jgi:hypothetical protein
MYAFMQAYPSMYHDWYHAPVFAPKIYFLPLRFFPNVRVITASANAAALNLLYITARSQQCGRQ